MNALDTNVLIYCCDQRDPARQRRALELVGSLRDSVIPWQVACEFIAASRKLAPNGFTSEHAWARLSEFLRLMPLLVPSPSALDRARTLHLGYKLSFWDATIIGSCLDAGIGTLYSQDLPGTGVDGLQVVNPFL